jgi:hypothetical protein
VAKRNVIPVVLEKGKTHISINGDAKSTVRAVAERHGMKEIAVASRIYLWFAAQDDVVQKGVLGLLPSGYEAEVIKLALEKMSKAKK